MCKQGKRQCIPVNSTVLPYSFTSVCLLDLRFIQSFQLSQYLLHLAFAFSLSLASGPSFLCIFCRVSSLSQHLLHSLHYVNILRFKSPIRRYLLFQSSARYSLVSALSVFSPSIRTLDLHLASPSIFPMLLFSNHLHCYLFRHHLQCCCPCLTTVEVLYS